MSDRLIFFLGTLSFKATQFQSYSSSGTQVQEKRRDKSFQVPAEEAGPGYRLGHQTISKRSSKCWLLIGHKKILCRYYCSQSANSIPELFSCVRTRRLFFSPYLQRNARNQETFSLTPFDTVHFKILSSRKLKHGTVCNGILKTLFQKYKLDLTISLHRSHLRKYL